MKRIIMAAAVLCMFPVVARAQLYGLQNDSTPKITVQGEALEYPLP